MKYRNPFGGTTQVDLRNGDQVDTVLRHLASMSALGQQELLRQVEALPDYTKHWRGTQRVLADLRRRLGLGEGV